MRDPGFEIVKIAFYPIEFFFAEVHCAKYGITSHGKIILDVTATLKNKKCLV